MIERETIERIVLRCDQCGRSFTGANNEPLHQVASSALRRGWCIRGIYDGMTCPLCGQAKNEKAPLARGL